MTEQTKNILLGLSIALLVLACGAFIGVKVDSARWAVKSINMSKEANKAQSSYQKKFNKLQYAVNQDNSRSNNPVLKSMSLQNGSEELITSVGNRFFNTLYTWNSADQFASRKSKLASITDEKLQKNKDVFGNKSAIKMVKATGLTSNFDSAHYWIESVDDHNINAIARVKYNSAYSGSPSGTGIRTYELTYSKDQQKITNLNLLQNSIEQ